MLSGTRFVITGVVTRGSVAYHVAPRAQELGAELALGSSGRPRNAMRALAAVTREPELVGASTAGLSA